MLTPPQWGRSNASQSTGAWWMEWEEEHAPQSRPCSSRQHTEDWRSLGTEDNYNLPGAAARAEPEVPAPPQSSEASSSQYTEHWDWQAWNQSTEAWGMEVEPGEVESKEEPAPQSRPSSSRQPPQSSEASSSQYTEVWDWQASNTCGEYLEEHWCSYCQRKLERMTQSAMCHYCWKNKQIQKARTKRGGANASKNRENYQLWLKRYKELQQTDARYAALWKEHNPAPWVHNNAYADATWVEQLVDDRVLQELVRTP